MSEKLLNYALAHVNYLADKADCLDSVNEIRNMLIKNPYSNAEHDFNNKVNAICDELEKQIDEQKQIVEIDTPSEKEGLIVKINHYNKMIKLWEAYIEENKCSILVAENDEDEVAIKEYQFENRVHRK